MRDQEPIIVIHHFDSFIEANIVKSKLDAYGIPCFLSEENVTFLTTSLLSGGIRLHIFEHDKDRVIELLVQERMHKSEDDDLVQCPFCHSRKILINSSALFQNASVVKFLLQLTKRHYCLHCEAEFD